MLSLAFPKNKTAADSRTNYHAQQIPPPFRATRKEVSIKSGGSEYLSVDGSLYVSAIAQRLCGGGLVGAGSDGRLKRTWRRVT